MRYLILVLFFQWSFAQNDSIIKFGENLINENKLTDAVLYFNQNLSKTTDLDQKVLLYFGLADAFRLDLQYDEASRNYAKAYEVLKQTKNEQLTFLYRVKMAEFYRKRTLFEDAVAQLDFADAILKNNDIEERYVGKYYNRKAALFTEFYQNKDSTLFYANKSLEIAKKIGDKDNFFYSLLEIIGVYNSNKDFKKSIESSEILIKYAKEHQMVQPLADVYINYTRALRKDNQPEKALAVLFEALEFAEKHQLLFHQNIYTIDIYLIYKEQKNYEKAIEFIEKRLELSERYYQSEHNQYLFDLEKKYKVGEKENQIRIKNLELENKNKELSANKVGLFVILGLLFTAILVVFLVAYFLKKSKKTNKELQFLSTQNQFLLSEANHRINNNLQLIIILITSQIKKIPEKEGEEVKKILKKINSIATLHRHLYQSEDKRNVNSNKYFKDVEMSFYDLFEENQIKSNFEVEAMELPADLMMYLGLLLTELCINSIKYAFENQEDKKIQFRFEVHDNILNFTFSDNGVGMSENDGQLKLIDKLCRQLKIQYNLENINGLLFSFKKELPKP